MPSTHYIGNNRNRSNTQEPNLHRSITGLGHGLIAVMLFGLTVPMTSLALNIFTPEIIALIRATVAGSGSLLLVWLLGWRLPYRRELPGLLIGGAAVTLVFPYLLSLTLERWPASNTGVVLAAIPLFTALIGSLMFKERHPLAFWLSLLLGTGLLIDFTWKAGDGFHLSVFIMLLAAAIGYGAGGHVAKTLGGWRTICWMTVLYLPLTLIALGYYSLEFTLPLNWTDSSAALLAMAYLALISQWLGFHFWYGAMAKAGIGRIGQVQLLQPFFTLLFSAPLLGLALQAQHFVYAGLISISVLAALRFKH